MPLILRENIGRRLTISEMDGNFTYLESLAAGSAISLTNTEAIDLMNTAGIKSGTNYLITNTHPGLYGNTSQFTYGLTGTNIILKGIDSTHFSTDGHGQFYNPIYASYSMWDYSATYSINDTVIFGGQVWVNTTGNTGNTLGDGYDSSSFISLDSADWQVQSYTNSALYNCVWDEIEYDIIDDVIISRYEAFGNNLVQNSSKTYWFHCEINPIQSFRWGSYNETGPTVADCKIIDSYFGCLNMINGNISDVELTNFSWIYNITLTNYGYIYGLKISNNSGINTFILDGSSYLGNITLDNNSTIYNFAITSECYMEYINITNYSNIYDFYINGGYISKATLTNGSSINNFTLHDANCIIEWIDLSFGSIYNFDIYSASYIEEIKITNDCTIHDFTLHSDSYMSCITLEGDSHMSNVYLYNGSYLETISIKHYSIVNGVYLCDYSGSNCYISYVEITNNSRLWDDDDSIYLNDGGYMTAIKIENNSVITNINMYGDSYRPYMQNIIISNGAIIDNIQFNAYNYQSYVDTLNVIGGGFENIQLYDSYMNYINISSGSMDSLYLSNNSYLQHIEIINGAISATNWITETTDSIYLDNSYMSVLTIQQSVLSGYITLANNSYLTNIHLSNYSTIVGGYREYGDAVNNIGEYNYIISLNNSGINTLTLDNNSFFGLGAIGLTNSSYISNVSLNNASKISGYITLDNGTISNVTLDNESRFGRGNSESDGNSSSIELHNASSIRDMNLANAAVVDGFIYLSNSHILDVTLSGIADWNDSVSPSGTNYDFDNGTGIIFGGGMELYDSALSDIEITNGSYMTGLDSNEIYLESNSYMQCIKADNGSIINDVYLSNSFMKNIEVLNGSYIYNIDLEIGSSITYLSVSNYSFIGDYIHLSNNSYLTFIKVDNNSELFGGDYGDYDITLTNSSNMQNIEVLNNSSITGIIFDGTSYFNTIAIKNGSSMYDLQLYNASYLNCIEVTNNSGIGGIRLSDDSGSESYMLNISLTNDSHISNVNNRIYIEDGGYISNVTMNNNCWFSGYLELYSGSFINNLKLDNNSYFGYDINLENGSYINDVNISNNSYITGYIRMVASGFDYINVVNNSWINNYNNEDESYFYGTYLYNIELLNYSKIYNQQYTNSAMGQLNMNNNSKMYNNTFNDYSAIEYTTLNNRSVFSDNTISNSIFSKGILNNSNYQTNDVSNSNIDSINLNDSQIYENSIYDASGLYDIVLSDSDIYIMTMTSSSVIADVQMYYSDIHNNNMINSYITANSISDSFIYNNYMYSSNMSDLLLTAISNIYGSTLTSSNINYCQLHGGEIHNQTMNSALISGVMLRTSLLDSNTFYSGGALQNVDISKNSVIANCYFGAYIQNSSLESSYIGTTNLINGNGVEFLYMRDSNFESYAGTSSWISNLDMLGATFNFGGGNYLIPFYTNANTNTIKYQFSVNFDGSAGYGEIGSVNIPPVLIPGAGWYIEKVIVDNNNTGSVLVSGTSSYLNIGNNVDSNTGLDDTKGNVSSMAGKITVSDLSNGGADGTKTTTIGSLTMNVEGGNITAGTISVEVILKNTNYGTNND